MIKTCEICGTDYRAKPSQAARRRYCGRPCFEQARNRVSNINVTYQGETLCLKDWSERLSIPYHTLRARIVAGWSVERAFTAAVRKRPCALSGIAR